MLSMAWAMVGCSVVVGGKLDDKDRDAAVDGSTPEDGSTPTCRAEDCDDGEPCNGAERCDGDVCASGTPLEPGYACSTETIADGSCRASGDVLLCAARGCGDGETMGDEECDDAN